MTARYKSRFEFDFATYLENNNIEFEYEQHKFTYVPKQRTYTPDFYLPEYDMFIETKGQFVGSDRSKHKLIAEQYPDLDLRFVFQNDKVKLSKKCGETKHTPSKTVQKLSNARQAVKQNKSKNKQRLAAAKQSHVKKKKKPSGRRSTSKHKAKLRRKKLSNAPL